MMGDEHSKLVDRIRQVGPSTARELSDWAKSQGIEQRYIHSALDKGLLGLGEGLKLILPEPSP